MKSKPGTEQSLKIDIEYVAQLANLSLTSHERKNFEKQLSEILNYFSKLNEIDTEKVEPIGHITGFTNVSREDKTAPSIPQEDALANAPKAYKGFFVIEAIFEEN